MFSRHLPQMKFYRFIQNFLDAQVLFSRVFNNKAQIGLAKVVKQAMNLNMCKGEQMSNWEKRPLRLSQ